MQSNIHAYAPCLYLVQSYAACVLELKYLMICLYSQTVNFATNGKKSGDKIAAFTAEKLQGEFCYVQTQDGKITAIHFSPTDNHDGINVKRGIASTFQANFDYQEEVEESDPGSHHISHYK